MSQPRDILGPAILCAALLLAVAGIPRVASAQVEISVSAPLLSLARGGSWLPIQVEISSPRALDGRIVIRCQRGGCPPTEREFSLPAGSPHRFEIPVQGRGWTDSWQVDALDRRGRRLARQQLRASGGLADPSNLHVALLGEDPIGWTLLRETWAGPVPGHEDQSAETRSVRAEVLLPEAAPASWMGWSGVDIVVWARPDPGRLDPDQQRALRAWVVSGGTLLIALGDNHPLWFGSPLSALIPARAHGLSSSAAVAAAVLQSKRLPPRGQEHRRALMLPFVQIEAEADTSVTWATTGGQALALQRFVGGGSVVLLAFDPAAGELRLHLDRERFWRRLFALPEPDGEVEQPALAGPLRPLDEIQGPCPVPRTFREVGGGLSTGQARESWRDALRQQITGFDVGAPLPLAFLVVLGLRGCAPWAPTRRSCIRATSTAPTTREGSSSPGCLCP